MQVSMVYRCHQPLIVSTLLSNRRVIFFTPDIHDGTRIDLVSTMVYLNQTIVISSAKPTLPKYYHSSFTIYNDLNGIHYPAVVNPGQAIPNRKFPPIVKDESLLKQYFPTIVNHSVFKKVDCVICMFYPSHCQYFIPFNKTIVFLAAHRFNLKRCEQEEVRKLIHWMFSYPDHIISIAGSVYDQEYLYYFTGRRVPILYSSSLFVKPLQEEYNPEFEEIVVAPFKNKDIQFEHKIMEACQRNGLNITFTTVLRKLGKGWKLEDLNKFKAIIVFPYAVLSYYINDILASGVPLFVPSPTFLTTLQTMKDYRNTQSYYCPNSATLPQHKNSNHLYSPEDDTPEAQAYWFKYATFYTPASIQFDSWDDLVIKLKTTDLKAKFMERRQENIKMMKHNINMWKKIIKKVKQREMPKSYEEALRYFNTTSFY